jgi:hypothetical protein
MTLEDRKAADALVRLLETMRKSGCPQGRIEIIVFGGQAREVKIFKALESVVLDHG